MSTASYGTPADIENLPTPAATVAIASSTTGANTVITTSAAHGLQTGMAAIISGHLVNTDANGIWIATVLTGTTFRISTFAAFPGTFVTGNGVGAATGNVQSLALPGITLPEDGVDDIDASTVNVPLEALHDMVQWLVYRSLAKQVVLKGGTRLLKAGSSGSVEAGASETVYGDLIIETNGLTAPSVQILSGTVSYPDPQRKGDAAATINVGDGQHVLLTVSPTTARAIDVNTPTRDGQWIEFSLHSSANNPATKYYQIERAGSANYIARLTGWSTDQATNLGSGVVRIHAEGGVWRLTGGVGIELGADA